MSRFKGGPFENRYKLTGILTLKSALHIGDGDMKKGDGRLPEPKPGEDIPKYSSVMTDINGRAFIPGSTIKGNLRAWLEQIFTSFDLAATNDTGRENTLRSRWDDCVKRNNTSAIHATLRLRLTEYMFGSGINEGKMEFEDALMLQQPANIDAKNLAALPGYDDRRGTMMLKGVAIDPRSGTAAKNKLYNFEASPRGARFRVTVTGQNLSDAELGMTLFALEGFNSEIYPVTIGAMGGIGFGRAAFEVESLFCLNKENLKMWLESAIENGHAGYTGLVPLSPENRKAHIATFRNAFKEKILRRGA